MSDQLLFNPENGEIQVPQPLPEYPDTRRWPTRTPYNHKYLPQGREYNNQPSQTIQDQNMSLSELVARSMRGQPIYGSLPINFGEVHMPNMLALDLSEQKIFRAELDRQVQQLRNKVEDEKQRASQLTPSTQPNFSVNPDESTEQ